MKEQKEINPQIADKNSARAKLMRAVRRQIRQRGGECVSGLKSSIDMLEYLNLFIWDARKLASTALFLDAMQGDIVGALYAAAIEG